MKSKFQAYAQPYSRTPSETLDGVVSEEKDRNLEVSNKDMISETTNNISIPSNPIKHEYTFSPGIPHVEHDDMGSFGSLWASSPTDKIEKIGLGNASCKANYGLSSLLNTSGGGNYYNAHSSTTRNALPYNMTFGSFNFSTSMLSQSINSNSYQTVSSDTAGNYMRSPYVLNVVKKMESKDRNFDGEKVIHTSQVKFPDSRNPISTNTPIDVPDLLIQSPSDCPFPVSFRSKKFMEQRTFSGIEPVGDAESSVPDLADLDYFSDKNKHPPQTGSVKTILLSISEATARENALQGSPAEKDGSVSYGNRKSFAVPSQQRTKPTTVSFAERELEDTVGLKSSPSAFSSSFKSFVKPHQYRRRYSLNSDGTIEGAGGPGAGGDSGPVKGMISFRHQGSLYSWRNPEKSVENDSYSYGYTTLSNDDMQSFSTRPALPNSLSYVDISKVASASTTLSDFAIPDDDEGEEEEGEGEDASVGSAAGVSSTCMTDRLQKWKTKSGLRFVNQYQVLEDLGHGTCARVKLAYDTVHSRLVALKEVLRADPKRRLGGPTQAQLHHESFVREVAVMRRLRHKNIVRLYEVIEDPNADELYLVMQYVDKGVVADIQLNDDSDKVCEPMAPSRVGQIGRQVLAGLEYLHHRNVVHRDIKPQNILIDSNSVSYLSDFGLAEVFDRQYIQRMHQMMEQSMSQNRDQIITEASDRVQKIWGVKGTVLFIAPEVWKGSSTNGKPMDIWAMGVTLFSLLTGRLPFTTIEAVKDPTRLAIPTEYGAGWTKLLKGMLEHDPIKRLTVSQARFQLKKIIRIQTEQDSIKSIVITDHTLKPPHPSNPAKTAEDDNPINDLDSPKKFALTPSPVLEAVKSAPLAPQKPPLEDLLPIKLSLGTPPVKLMPPTDRSAALRRGCQRCQWMSFCNIRSSSPRLTYGSSTKSSTALVEGIEASGKQIVHLSVVDETNEVPKNANDGGAESKATETSANSLKQIYTFPRAGGSMHLPEMQGKSFKVRRHTTRFIGHLSSSLAKIAALNESQKQPSTLASQNSRTPQLPPLANLLSTSSAKASSERVKSVSSLTNHPTYPLKKDATGKY
ncbi:unnamed protein product [Phytomonas sp. Hart1]|nr:unnamed protein product [Phytomonas sp. Hart1]|eukprot:CCW67673.1 unnamed protein product [Phytomonas sp. isolate Hart1]